MGRSLHTTLLVALLLGLTCGASYADLVVEGTKDFTYRDFSVEGSLHQFLAENPVFLTERGLDQSLRLAISGKIGERVTVDATLDDSNDFDEDRKLRIAFDGEGYDVVAGLLTLAFPGTRYLIFNKKALAITAEGTAGRHTISGFVGRPEGEPRRDFFRGLGAQREYLLTAQPVVQGSEIVHLDGRTLVRGTEYAMDYEGGAVMLEQSTLPVEATSTIVVEYEALSLGSSYQSTIFGIRDRIAIGDAEKGNHVGVSLVGHREQDSVRAAELTTRTPEELLIVGADFDVAMPLDVRALGELAISSKDTDLRQDADERRSDLAHVISLRRKSPRTDVDLRHEYVGPEFEAVGRQAFSQVGENQDLAKDLEQTALSVRWDILPTLWVDNEASYTRTNVEDRLDRPTRTNDGLETALSWDYVTSGNLLLRRRDDQEESRFLAPDPVASRRKVEAGTLRQQILGAQVQAQGQRETLEGAVPGGAPSDRIIDSMTLSFSRPLPLDIQAGLTVGGQDTETALGAPVRDTIWSQLDLHHTLSRGARTDLTLLRREETDRETGTRADFTTGELHMNYQPHDTLNVNLRGSVEERSRVLRYQPDPNLAAIEQQVAAIEQAFLARTLVTEKPVLTLQTSAVVDWRPTSVFDIRLMHRVREETERDSGLELSLSETAGGQLKWAPTAAFRTRTDVQFSDTRNAQGGIARDGRTLEQELLWSCSDSLNLALTGTDTVATDPRLIGPEHERKLQLRGDKVIRRNLSANASIAYLDRTLGGNAGEAGVSFGVLWSPEGMDMRLAVQTDLYDIDGINALGDPFASHRRKVEVRVDGRPTEGLTVEMAVGRISAGPNLLGDVGYDANLVEAKAYYNF